jgi:tRNA (guanine-N7-)-methyltransferase
VLAVIEPMVAVVEASGCFARPKADARPWRLDNPLPVATERESLVMRQGLPVYRVLYVRNEAPVPTPQSLEDGPKGTDNPATTPAPEPAATPGSP